MMESSEGMSLKEYLEAKKGMVDEALDRFLPGESGISPEIFKSARYSVFAGGKRIRPILCMAAAEALGQDGAMTLPVACALEMIHTYSLIHDDLPAMDDDDYRRGMPTNHKVFGEDIAILAGDALLTEAFYLMSGSDLVNGISPDRLLRIMHEISKAAGFFGMIGGQVIDLKSEGQDVTMETLNRIHTLKTEALITVSVRAGAIIAGADEHELRKLSEYGSKIGLAFQIADDILDIEGDQEILGKDTGSDREKMKVTFPALIGIESSREKARGLIEEALTALASFDERAEPLRMIARFIVERKS
jgi:geranylgeranyl diphosphate synthase type II